MCPQPFLRHAWPDFVQTWHKHSTWWHTRAPHFILQSDKIWPTGRLAAILVVKKKIPVIKHVLNHFSDMHSLILFKLGTQLRNDDLTFDHQSFSRSDARWPIGGHFSWKKKPDVEHTLNNFSDLHLPMLFKLGTSTVHDGIHMHPTLFCGLIKDGPLVDLQPF